MAASDIEVCNKALVTLGAQTITSLSSSTPTDRELLCQKLYPDALKAVLRSHPWNCATRRCYLVSPGPSTTDKDTALTVAGRDVFRSNATAAHTGLRAVRGASTLLRYFEVVVRSTITDMSIGVCAAGHVLTNYIGVTSNGWSYRADGQKSNNATTGAYGAAYNRDDVIGVALNLTAGTLTFYLNGVTQGTAYAAGLTGATLFPAVTLFDVSTQVEVNMVSSLWAQTPPAGYVEWPSLQAPETDWTYSLPLPTDWLRTMAVGLKDDTDNYRQEGAAILSNKNPLALQYVGTLAESAMDAQLSEVLTAYMVWKLAYPITKSSSQADQRAAEYQAIARMARTTDGQEQPIEFANDQRLVTARTFGRFR